MSFKQIQAPVYMWVQGPGDPPDPDYGHPDWGGRPDNSLPGGGHIDNSLPWAPAHPGNKPPGRPILPPSIDNGLPPASPPHIWGGGGRWEILDPGFGKPPLIGLIPPDPGWGIEDTPPPPTGPKPPGGQWVPTDPDYGMPVHGCPGGKPKPPLWVWIPTPPDFSKPVPPAQPK